MAAAVDPTIAAVGPRVKALREAMDLSFEVLSTIKQLAEKPHGIMLCVGPTGSGKTTTLHAVLRHINTDGRKILTAEDPIEITQEGLRQVQVQPKIGFTFAAAMRAFLIADTWTPCSIAMENHVARSTTR